MNGPFSRFEDRGPVKGVFSCDPCKEEQGFLFVGVAY